MRKILVLMAIWFLTALPIFAQHSHGGGSHAQSAPHHDEHGRAVQNQPRATERHFHTTASREGYHYTAVNRAEFARHWNGWGFDRPFFESRWGAAHPFYWGHCGWYGPRWRVGSYFWFGGAYFSVVDTIPYEWYDDEVEVIYDQDCDCYFAVNPLYPNVRLHVGIRF